VINVLREGYTGKGTGMRQRWTSMALSVRVV
jgi:hypothetical protein